MWRTWSLVLVAGRHAAIGVATSVDYGPSLFLRFENASDVGEDSSGNGRNLKLPKPNARLLPPQQQETGGPVGGYLCFGSDLEAPGNASKPQNWGAHTTLGLPAAPGLTLEFLLKPNPGFLRGGEAAPLPGLTFETQSISWEVTTDLGIRELVIPLDGAGPEAADYLWGSAGDYDGWHHLALAFDAKTGRMEMWVDGISTPTMQTTVNASHTVSAMSEFIVDSRNPVRLSACLDEIAVFPEALPASLIYQHFEDTLKKHQKYDLTDPQTLPPAPPVYPSENSSDYFDPKEYPAGEREARTQCVAWRCRIPCGMHVFDTMLWLPTADMKLMTANSNANANANANAKFIAYAYIHFIGTQLPSPDGSNNTLGTADSCVAQLHTIAAPRFNASSIAKYYTPFNFNWMEYAIRPD